MLALLFAAGPSLPLGHGRVLHSYPYLLAYHTLPFFDRLWFPYRLVVMVFLSLSIGIGTVILRLERTAWGRRAAWLLVLLPVLGGMVEQHQNLAYPLLHRDFRPPQVYTEIGERGGALIEVPIGIARVSIAWQAVHRQPTFGGMAENAALFWPPGYDRRLHNSFIRMLRQISRNPLKPRDFRQSDLQRLVAEGYRWVVLDRHLLDSDLHRWRFSEKASHEDVMAAPFLAQDHLTGVIGPPVAVEGALVLWDLVGGGPPFPTELQPTSANLSERTWDTEDMPEYEAHLRAQGRLRSPTRKH